MFFGKARLKTQLAVGAVLMMSAAFALAADLLTFKLEMQDGKFIPARIEVPAGQRIKIEIHNIGKSAAEFESVELRKEKVLAPGAQSFVVLAPLRPGEYKFFDDFHLNMPQGVIVAK
ncbi:cupredoxin domain-containing protein [Herbaspirillum autotrophicum]|uniref:cupredoxin domain-containing protein n=1 Tax=Herbaspirillum autotrophicum TaxID=180195 RepID=UPI00067CDB95|nr:cupredoxin domain-containing protein [Herbaspirillum autotrophicum]